MGLHRSHQNISISTVHPHVVISDLYKSDMSLHKIHMKCSSSAESATDKQRKYRRSADVAALV